MTERTLTDAEIAAALAREQPMVWDCPCPNGHPHLSAPSPLSRALRQLQETRAALRDISTHHYPPEFGGYCWCRKARLDALSQHEAMCLQIRALLGEE